MPSITLSERRIRYRHYGEPGAQPPLYLIHGAAGGQYVWLAQRHLQGLQVITLDLPGHGGSDPAPEAVDIAWYASQVAQLATALDHPRIIPVGHSMGGAVALSLALDAPHRTAALILLATGARLPVSELVFAAIDQGFDQLGELLAQTAYAPHTDRALVAQLTNGPLQVTQAQARADFEACAQFDVRARLAELNLPTLVLSGEHDLLVSAGRLQQLTKGIRNSQLHAVPDAGHMLMQEQPDRVNAALETFVHGLSEPD